MESCNDAKQVPAEGRLKRRHPDDAIDDTPILPIDPRNKMRRLNPDESYTAVLTSVNNPHPQQRGMDGGKDWRQILCDALRLSPNVSDETLELDIQDMINPEQELESGLPMEPVPEPFYLILHRVHCARQSHPITFCSQPFLVRNDDFRITSHLAGQDRVTDVPRYIARNRGISFVVIRVYTCCNSQRTANPTALVPQDDVLIFCSEELCETLCTFRSTTQNGEKLFPKFKTEVEFACLHPAFYWRYKELSRLPETTAGGSNDHLGCFLDYLDKQKRGEFDEATLLFKNHQVTNHLLPYLFAPMAIIVEEVPQGRDHFRCVQVLSQPRITSKWGDEVQKDSRRSKRSRKDDDLILITITFEKLAWEYDGNFRCKESTMTKEFYWRSESRRKAMHSLGIYPFDFADVDVRNMIRNRGEMFWKCRLKNYISYTGWDVHNQEYFCNSRFMIDTRAYKTSVPLEQRSPNSYIEEFPDCLGTKVMENEEPPSNSFILMLPATLNGFSMDEKEWKGLLVTRMCDVVWDESAFHNLVLPGDTKDVIRALVTCRVSGPSTTDIIRGKGSGLILLFHGPPGTGKTLTAESVAEFAKKPLYRVTCGDIGTNPESVERFLGSVLERAKLWNCVVLLDEAEVFPQERSLTDLHRNALVSVFLRILEYHDGILILTSNRVGTLDEGFKSRIQLGIEYPKLDGRSRRRVWDNFINSLENDPAGLMELDIPDLRRNVDNLATYELNGREIRNALNVARPLALSNETKVDYSCLKKVIDVQKRFGQYIIDMNEGLDDEKVAREDGKR